MQNMCFDDVFQVDAPMMMRAMPVKVKFIILQGPSHASLAEGDEE